QGADQHGGQPQVCRHGEGTGGADEGGMEGGAVTTSIQPDDLAAISRPGRAPRGQRNRRAHRAQAERSEPLSYHRASAASAARTGVRPLLADSPARPSSTRRWASLSKHSPASIWPAKSPARDSPALFWIM